MEERFTGSSLLGKLLHPSTPLKGEGYRSAVRAVLRGAEQGGGLAQFSTVRVVDSATIPSDRDIINLRLMCKKNDEAFKPFHATDFADILAIDTHNHHPLQDAGLRKPRASDDPREVGRAVVTEQDTLPVQSNVRYNSLVGHPAKVLVETILNTLCHYQESRFGLAGQGQGVRGFDTENLVCEAVKFYLQIGADMMLKPGYKALAPVFWQGLDEWLTFAKVVLPRGGNDDQGSIALRAMLVACLQSIRRLKVLASLEVKKQTLHDHITKMLQTIDLADTAIADVSKSMCFSIEGQPVNRWEHFNENEFSYLDAEDAKEGGATDTEYSRRGYEDYERMLYAHHLPANLAGDMGHNPFLQAESKSQIADIVKDKLGDQLLRAVCGNTGERAERFENLIASYNEMMSWHYNLTIIGEILRALDHCVGHAGMFSVTFLVPSLKELLVNLQMCLDLYVTCVERFVSHREEFDKLSILEPYRQQALYSLLVYGSQSTMQLHESLQELMTCTIQFNEALLSEEPRESARVHEKAFDRVEHVHATMGAFAQVLQRQHGRQIPAPAPPEVDESVFPSVPGTESADGILFSLCGQDSPSIPARLYDVDVELNQQDKDAPHVEVLAFFEGRFEYYDLIVLQGIITLVLSKMSDTYFENQSSFLVKLKKYGDNTNFLEVDKVRLVRLLNRVLQDVPEFKVEFEKLSLLALANAQARQLSRCFTQSRPVATIRLWFNKTINVHCKSLNMPKAEAFCAQANRSLELLLSPLADDLTVRKQAFWEFVNSILPMLNFNEENQISIGLWCEEALSDKEKLNLHYEAQVFNEILLAFESKTLKGEVTAELSNAFRCCLSYYLTLFYNLSELQSRKHLTNYEKTLERVEVAAKRVLAQNEISYQPHPNLEMSEDDEQAERYMRSPRLLGLFKQAIDRHSSDEEPSVMSRIFRWECFGGL